MSAGRWRRRSFEFSIQGFSTSAQVARYAKSVKGEKGRQFTYSTNNKTLWGARALNKK